MYSVISWYKFIEINDPEKEVKKHKAYMAEHGMAGRVYIAKEGINSQCSGPEEQAKEYIDWVLADPRFSDVLIKVQPWHENAFPRLTVKVRDQLAAMDEQVDTSKGGTYVKPKEWREMLEKDDFVKIDVRNDYEWDLGHFKDFDRPECRTFREFPDYARKLKEKVDPKKAKVMMCCTGGIRCELYSALMKKEGFENVYQLEGGIIKYGEEELGKHWEGKLFVFDDRLGVPVNQEEETSTAHCHLCNTATDGVYNCANMECNELFFSCPDCIEKTAGCCQESCRQGEKVRPLDHQRKGKPFRRWYKYFNEKSA